MTDLRPDRPDLWSEPTAFGDRAHFRVSTRPAVLSVTGVQRFDAGTYTCRVDFRQSPTVYHHVKLDIIGELWKMNSDIMLQALSIFTWKRMGQSENEQLHWLDQLLKNVNFFVKPIPATLKFIKFVARFRFAICFLREIMEI